MAGKIELGVWVVSYYVRRQMKQLVNLLTDLIVKYTPFKGQRTKLAALTTIIGSIALITTGGLEPEVGGVLIVTAAGNLFAAVHKN